MNTDKLFIATQHLLPQHLLSRCVGWLAGCEVSWIKNPLIRAFIKQYDVNMAEAKRQTAEEFSCFNDFFTRELEDGARTFITDENTVCYPVDGAISQQGPIEQGQLIQAKGFNYSLETLLGGDKATACLLYTSPSPRD